MPDIVEIIKSQHRQVDKLLEQAEQQAEEKSQQTKATLRQVSDLLLPHSRAEESFVYPTIREKRSDEAEQVHDSVAEHHQVEEMLDELLTLDVDEPGYDGKLAALVGALRHHVEEEEQDLLPVLGENASDDERAEMGARFARETAGGGSDGDARPAATSDDMTRNELYDKAKEQDVAGRSSMTKEELKDAVQPE